MSDSVLYLIIPSSEINNKSLDKILKALKYLKDFTGDFNNKKIVKNIINLNLFLFFLF